MDVESGRPVQLRIVTGASPIEEELRSPKGGVIRSASTSSTSSLGTTRKRLSSLGTALRTSSAELGVELSAITNSVGSVGGDQSRMRISSVSLSPVASPVFQSKTYVDTPAPPPLAFTPQNGEHHSSGKNVEESPFLVVGPPEIHPITRTAGILAGRRNQVVQKNRLMSFGLIVTALSAILWFSVYQRHSFLGFTDNEESSIKRGPWMILALVLLFLGIAAVCAGLSIQKEDDRHRVRVVRGDSDLGMIAERGSSRTTDYSEPTTPQRVWAMKAIAEMDRL